MWRAATAGATSRSGGGQATIQARQELQSGRHGLTEGQKGHGHSHASDGTSPSKRLIIGMALSAAFVIGEFTVGLMIHSLSLVSDAAHNTADILAMGLTLFAVYMIARQPTERQTYGFGRVGILAALGNAIGLVVIAGIIGYEAIQRIIHIVPVKGGPIIIVSAIGVLLNGGIALMVARYRKDLNVKSAFLHMASDAVVSFGVMIAGIIIVFTKWYYADPVISMAIGLVIVYVAWELVRDAVSVLLESVPPHIKLEEVEKSISSIGGVTAAHDMHVWELGSGVYALSAHVEIDDCKVSESVDVLKEINAKLESDFNITHPTIQLETPGGVCTLVPEDRQE